MTWVIFPTALGVAISSSYLVVRMIWSENRFTLFGIMLLKRLGAGDDLDQFLGDHRLTRPVVRDGLLADHFAGVARGVVHRRHARALLGRGVFQEIGRASCRERV